MLFKRNQPTEEQIAMRKAKDFFDRAIPHEINFCADHYVCGNSYRCCWAVTEYPPTTEEQAILAHLADRNNVTLHVYNRLVTSTEQRMILQQAMRKNRMMTSTNDVTESVKAEENINDTVALMTELRRNKEPLLHTAVFIELKASDPDKLRELQDDIQMELTRSRINVDRLLLRQQDAFLSVFPTGKNCFTTEYERILPASSAANLYPLNYSGKTDEHGFYLGKDKYGSSLVVDFDKRTDDKTNSNIGYLRIDFDKGGSGFYHNWFPKNQPLNTPEFRKEFDAVINTLRQDLLSDRKGMAQFNREHEGLNVDFDLARGNGYRVETAQHVYFLRCTPLRGDYDCYCYCYDKALFEEVLAEEQAQEPDMEMGVMQ